MPASADAQSRRSGAPIVGIGKAAQRMGAFRIRIRYGGATPWPASRVTLDEQVSYAACATSSNQGNFIASSFPHRNHSGFGVAGRDAA